MPFSIDITLNILWIPLICLLFAILGFIFRSTQLNKLREQIHKLEMQMRQSDAEILMLQKDNGFLQEQIKNNPVPVIPITTKENTEVLPDASSRKKLLSKPTANHQA
jgi:hypothetical protein